MICTGTFEEFFSNRALIFKNGMVSLQRRRSLNNLLKYADCFMHWRIQLRNPGRQSRKKNCRYFNILPDVLKIGQKWAHYIFVTPNQCSAKIGFLLQIAKKVLI